MADCPRLNRERSHGSWFYRVDTGRDPRTGWRREQRKGGVRTQREAQEAMARVASSVSTGEHRHDDKQAVATFLSGWLERKVEDGALRPSSVRMYRLYVEAHLVPALGPVRLQDLRPLHVEQLLRDLRRAGEGPDDGAPRARRPALGVELREPARSGERINRSQSCAHGCAHQDAEHTGCAHIAPTRARERLRAPTR